LAEIAFALLDLNVLGVDLGDLCRRRTFVEVLNEFVERALVTLCLSGHLSSSTPSARNSEGLVWWNTHGTIRAVLDEARDIAGFGLLHSERSERGPVN